MRIFVLMDRYRSFQMRGYSNDYNINVKTVGDFMGVMISLTSRKIGRLNKNCVWCVCVMMFALWMDSAVKDDLEIWK